MSIKENIEVIEQRISQVCNRMNIDRLQIVLVNVSKTKPIEILEEGYQAGMRIFGENKVQEIRDKYESFVKPDISWHMIGHLQRNKIKYIIDKVDLIHSVDSFRLAEAISEEAEKKDVTAHILVQVNMAMEDSKYGLHSEEVLSMVKSISQLNHIKVKGLMTIAPFVEDPEENRLIFRRMHQLSVDIKEQNLDNVTMDILSMGMTNDFEVAIEEGATMIRIGTALFGNRQYGQT